MDFSAKLPPQAVLEYLLHQAPGLPEAETTTYQQVSTYLLAISTHYEAQPPRSVPFGPACPTCTVENVLATLLHADLEVVLRMLGSAPASASLSASLQLAGPHHSLKWVASVIAFAQLLLASLNPGRLAGERVAAYLQQFA